MSPFLSGFLRRTVILFFSGLFIFLILEVFPGDPAVMMLGMNAQQETLEALRQSLNLDAAWYVRYGIWLVNFFRGNWGESFTYGVPIRELILEKFQVSLYLAVLTQAIILLIAIPTGVLTAYYKNFLAKSFYFFFVQLGIAVPNFWLGILSVLLFAVVFRWFPAGGFAGEEGFRSGFYSLILPAFSLAIPQSALLAKIIRSSVTTTIESDFVRTAKSKGAGNARILWQHIFPNSLSASMTIFGLQFSFLVSGAILIENIFYLPGLGRLIFQSLVNRDLIVIKTVLFLLMFGVTAVNLSVDFLLICLDPRLRKNTYEQ